MRRFFLLLSVLIALLIPAESVAGPFMVLHKRGSAWSVPAVADPAIEQSAKATAQATSITVTFSSAPANNSVVVVFMEISDYPSKRTVTPPDGFSLIEDTTYGSSHFASYYKVCGASEPTEYTFSISGTADYCSIVAYEISGADTVDPIYASSESTASSTSISVSGIAGYVNSIALSGCGSEMFPTSLDQPTVSTGWTVDQYAKPTYHSCAGASKQTDIIPTVSNTFTYSASSSLLAQMVFIRPANPGDLIYQCLAETDDGQWSAGVGYEGAYTSFGKYNTDPRNTAIRYDNVAIAKGTTIKSAKLVFSASDNFTGDDCNVRIYGVAADDQAAVATKEACEALNLTTAYVDWSSIPHWTAGETYETADISSIIQEIVNRDGWVSGNALMIVIKDNSSSSSSAVRGAATYPSVKRTILRIGI